MAHITQVYNVGVHGHLGGERPHANPAGQLQGDNQDDHLRPGAGFQREQELEAAAEQWSSGRARLARGHHSRSESRS